MSWYCKCYVALPQGVVGWSAVCDGVFPDHSHLLFPMEVLDSFLQMPEKAEDDQN